VQANSTSWSFSSTSATARSRTRGGSANSSGGRARLGRRRHESHAGRRRACPGWVSSCLWWCSCFRRHRRASGACSRATLLTSRLRFTFSASGAFRWRCCAALGTGGVGEWLWQCDVFAYGVAGETAQEASPGEILWHVGRHRGKAREQRARGRAGEGECVRCQEYSCL